MEEYFRTLSAAIDLAYDVARRARAEGLDPEPTVEIPRAEDMAMRVEKLLAAWPLEGIADEIRALAARLPREEVAIAIARRLASDATRSPDLPVRIEMALRVGLAVLTEGILVAPLEGLAEVHVRGPPDDRGYLELYYAGPIRAAGGTAQALSVLLADVVRRDAGLGRYVPEPAEIGRYREELPLYKRLQHLQYAPTPEEVELVVRNVPVCVSGEATEGPEEVSAFRNLARVPTNGIRGGACLVLAEGLCQKAAKVRKIVEQLGLPGWEFLASLAPLREGSGEKDGAPHDPTYLKEALGGRPVLAYPNRPGGFRLRYGRPRTGGLASCAVNPATMVILRSFVAIGTQVKLEYPGKASALTVCDTVEGPIVELDDATVTAVHDAAAAHALLPRIRRILDLGEMLVPFGEFLENHRPLEPGGYALEQHLEELRGRGVELTERALRPTYGEAVEDSHRWGVPLHPRHLLFWHDASGAELHGLARHVADHGRWVGDALELPNDPAWKELLGRLGWLHRLRDAQVLRGEPVGSAALVGGLGLAWTGSRFEPRDLLSVPAAGEGPLDLVSRLAGVPVRARSPSRIGARVGRPEKARPRVMNPAVHTLFPVGEAGGPRRSIREAAGATVGRGVPVELGVRRCGACGRTTVWSRCSCGTRTEPTGVVASMPFPVAPLWADAVQRLRLPREPEVKGVKGLMSRAKIPERLEKGLLRAFHGVAVYQDGTARYDLTDLPLTHVRPSEIGLSVDRAHSLGYVVDAFGAPLAEPEQLLELKPQDLVVAKACGRYLVHLAQFLDDELVRLYGLEPFYRASRPDDLVGAVLVALAPHTSGGVAGRLIGYTEAEACFAHPLFHAAKRRNCDGDEDSVTLLLDALLNFSRVYLPETRGALMDKPLVLTTRVDPGEVDREALSLDIAPRYPLAFYRAADGRRPAGEVEAAIETVGRRASPGAALRGYRFTHDTERIAGGPTVSAYREAGSMNRIVEQSLTLTAQLRAVDVASAVTLVLNAHFLPDLMGNLKSFATQKFRCKACGTTFRRPPLSGRCTAGPPGHPCRGELIPTVYEASVRKYLGLSQRLAETTGVTPYLRQRLRILEASLATMFPGTPAQTVLESFATAETPAPEGGTESNMNPDRLRGPGLVG